MPSTSDDRPSKVNPIPPRRAGPGVPIHHQPTANPFFDRSAIRMRTIILWPLHMAGHGRPRPIKSLCFALELVMMRMSALPSFFLSAGVEICWMTERTNITARLQYPPK
ncbi:hypothetical protein MCOR25_004344 [Pyricularia grisea]|nr:hypothetical protein MCOR25_004344 [Pyricularia grisea]